jgi:hypothetical protein
MGAPLAMDFYMKDAHVASHNENYVHFYYNIMLRRNKTSWTRLCALRYRILEERIRDFDSFSLVRYGATGSYFVPPLVYVVHTLIMKTLSFA